MPAPAPDAGLDPATGRPRPRFDPALLGSLAAALECVQAAAARRARALAELGDIDLPDDAPAPEDVERLTSVGPLYLAWELEQAGLLATAELVAGLFASGAITQPLGPTGQLIADFWRRRHERLGGAERVQILNQVFEARSFYPLMRSLCQALTSLLDNPARQADVHARVLLREAAETLGGWLAGRSGGMVGYAAEEIVATLSKATRFLRDRLLQTAFGVHDLWGLVEVVNRGQGQASPDARRRVELGRAGATVLGWLAAGVGTGYALDPVSPEGQQLTSAAEAWLLAYQALPAAASQATSGAPGGPPLGQAA